MNYYDELIKLLKYQFELKNKLKSNLLKETHLLKINRKKIARLKTFISIKKTNNINEKK